MTSNSETVGALVHRAKELLDKSVQVAGKEASALTCVERELEEAKAKLLTLRQGLYALNRSFHQKGSQVSSFNEAELDILGENIRQMRFRHAELEKRLANAFVTLRDEIKALTACFENPATVVPFSNDHVMTDLINAVTAFNSKRLQEMQDLRDEVMRVETLRVNLIAGIKEITENLNGDGTRPDVKDSYLVELVDAIGKNNLRLLNPSDLSGNDMISKIVDTENAVLNSEVEVIVNWLTAVTDGPMWHGQGNTPKRPNHRITMRLHEVVQKAIEQLRHMRGLREQEKQFVDGGKMVARKLEAVMRQVNQTTQWLNMSLKGGESFTPEIANIEGAVELFSAAKAITSHVRMLHDKYKIVDPEPRRHCDKLPAGWHCIWHENHEGACLAVEGDRP